MRPLVRHSLRVTASFPSTANFDQARQYTVQSSPAFTSNMRMVCIIVGMSKEDLFVGEDMVQLSRRALDVTLCRETPSGYDTQEQTCTVGSTTNSSMLKWGSSNIMLLHSAPHCFSQLFRKYGIRRQQTLMKHSFVTTSSPVSSKEWDQFPHPVKLPEEQWLSIHARCLHRVTPMLLIAILAIACMAEGSRSTSCILNNHVSHCEATSTHPG